MLHALASSSLGPTGTQSSESWLLWIHSRGSQPASPQAPAQPPGSALACMPPGGGGACRQLGPCPQACPGRGRGPEAVPSAGGARALSSSFLHTARLPGVWLGAPPQPLSRRPGQSQEGPLGARHKPARVGDPALPHSCAPGAHGSTFLSLDSLPEQRPQQGSQVVAMETIQEPVPAQWGL